MTALKIADLALANPLDQTTLKACRGRGSLNHQAPMLSKPGKPKKKSQALQTSQISLGEVADIGL